MTAVNDFLTPRSIAVNAISESTSAILANDVPAITTNGSSDNAAASPR